MSLFDLICVSYYVLLLPSLIGFYTLVCLLSSTYYFVMSIFCKGYNVGWFWWSFFRIFDINFLLCCCYI